MKVPQDVAVWQGSLKQMLLLVDPVCVNVQHAQLVHKHALHAQPIESTVQVVLVQLVPMMME